MKEWSGCLGSQWVLGESGGSLWVMGEWSVGHWIMGVMSFQKMYGLFSLKHLTAEISEDVTDAGRTTTKGKLR